MDIHFYRIEFGEKCFDFVLGVGAFCAQDRLGSYIFERFSLADWFVVHSAARRPNVRFHIRPRRRMCPSRGEAAGLNRPSN